MVKHYWSLCYLQHIHLISVVEVKTQTRFYSHQGHCSLGGTLRCLTWHLPQVFVCHLLSINYIPFLLRTSHNDRVCFLLTKIRLMEKRDGSNVGRHQHLPFAMTVSNSLPFPSRAVLPEQPQGLGEEVESLPWHCLPVGASWVESYRGQEIWSIDCMDKPFSGQGPLHEGSGWETDCLGLQQTQLALHLGVVTWGHLPYAAPLGGALGHPISKRGRGVSLQANQPSGSLLTPHHWPTSHLPNRVEWMWRTCYNLPTRLTGQWHKPYQRQVRLPGNWHPANPSRGTRPKGTTYWQALYHCNSQPP